METALKIICFIALVVLIAAVLMADANSALLTFFHKKWVIAILILFAGIRTTIFKTVININE